MNRWRVGEDRGSKEKDRCPLTSSGTFAMMWPLVCDHRIVLL
jgi:hypothetical protein